MERLSTAGRLRRRWGAKARESAAARVARALPLISPCSSNGKQHEQQQQEREQQEQQQHERQQQEQ